MKKSRSTLNLTKSSLAYILKLKYLISYKLVDCVLKYWKDFTLQFLHTVKLALARLTQWRVISMLQSKMIKNEQEKSYLMIKMQVLALEL